MANIDINYVSIYHQGNDKPVLTELLSNVIPQHATHWEDLGALLGVEHHHIDVIARDYRNQSVNACKEMMINWLQTVPSPTWGKLEDAINSLKEILASKPSGMYSITCVYVLL